MKTAFAVIVVAAVFVVGKVWQSPLVRDWRTRRAQRKRGGRDA